MHSLFVGALAFATATSALAGKSDGRLDIYWSDSDGGGSTLIVTPAGESVLIDSGNPGGRDSGRILNVLTNPAGLRQIDHLVITHLHIDHFGGAAELAAAVPVKNLWDNGLPDTDPDGNVDVPNQTSCECWRGGGARACPRPARGRSRRHRY